MAAPAPRRVHADEPGPTHPIDEPPLDPRAYQRALRKARARRRARIEHTRELSRARLRFLVLLGALLFLVALIGLSIWEKIEAVFGL